MLRDSLVVLGAALFASLVGCADAGPREPTAREKAEEEYGRSLRGLAAYLDGCADEVARTGTCLAPMPEDIASGTSPRNLVDRGAGLVRSAQSLLASMPTMCEALAPIARLQHPYFFSGGAVQGGVAVTMQLGMDTVWDLYNQQAAVFSYRGMGAETLVGAAGSAYVGYGFGDKPNVIEAWSGRFCQASGSLGLRGLPLAGIGVSGGVFASPDMSIVGAAVGVSGYVGWSPTVSGAVYASDWTPWNSATRELSRSGMGANSVQRDGAGHEYIQYASSAGMASALFWRAPAPLNMMVSAQVLALAAMRQSGLTIEQVCPEEVARATPPAIALAVGGLCGAVPNPIGGGS